MAKSAIRNGVISNNMGLLKGQEDTLKNGDKIVRLLEEKEELIYGLLIPGVRRVVTSNNLVNILESSLKHACFPLLSRYKSREIVKLDCKGLTRKDTYGVMARVAEHAKKCPALIVVIENIAGVWSDPNCEDPQYVENLIGHSWKNEHIYFGDYCIDRTEMTVILTVTTEYQEVLEQKYRTDSYAWIEDWDSELEALQKAMERLQ